MMGAQQKRACDEGLTSLLTFQESSSSAANSVPSVSAPYTGASVLGPSDRQNILTLRATSDSPGVPAPPLGDAPAAAAGPDAN